MEEHLQLKGCRHDILGHYLKAIGLMRVLARCADPDHADPEAEGWWNTERAWFCLRSARYPTLEKLIEFFEKHYRPTPVFSPWNTGGGLHEKKEVLFRCHPKPWHDYWNEHKTALLAHGFPEPRNGGIPDLPDKPFRLKQSKCELQCSEFITVKTEVGRQKKPVTKVSISWSTEARRNLFEGLEAVRSTLEKGIRFTNPDRDRLVEGEDEFVFNVDDEAVISTLPEISHVEVIVRTKESGKKAVMALLAKELKSHPTAMRSLSLGRSYFHLFQDTEADEVLLLEQLREEAPDNVAEAFDAIFSMRVPRDARNNPLFLNSGKGEGGNDEMFRQFWVLFLSSRARCLDGLARACLMGNIEKPCDLHPEVGYPFFPDAIKAYNIGSGWVQSFFPFNELDYVLAMEGAYALRGAASRTMGAGTKRFAAFPFVFETGDELTDGKEVKGIASALWLPLWDRPTTYEELASFILDAQARLPGKDARFSAEFVRALNVQGVDAGFAGWQEFRYKLKGSRVPWVSTGSYVDGLPRTRIESSEATLLNRALAPLDEAYFLDQFDPYRNKKTGKIEKDGPHRFRDALNSSMEIAALEPTRPHCLALLEAIFAACRQMCISESFREKLRGGRATFFKPLPMVEWNKLLDPLGEHGATSGAEFRIARALSSIKGARGQGNDAPAPVEPMVGSILPLKEGQWGWYLPGSENRHRQDVWSGTDLCHDLAAVLQRRYMDSAKHERPALMAVKSAPLQDVLALLRGELDDQTIARWTEAMSLIDWRFAKREKAGERDAAAEAEADKRLEDESLQSIPPAYAALRMLLELECEWQGENRSNCQKRRSQQPFTNLWQRSVSSLPLAVSEALRWISIWGVRNPSGAKALAEKKRITGRYVASITHHQIAIEGEAGRRLAARLAAAVCIPLAWQDRWQLVRVITLPPGN